MKFNMAKQKEQQAGFVLNDRDGDIRLAVLIERVYFRPLFRSILDRLRGTR